LHGAVDALGARYGHLITGSLSSLAVLRRLPVRIRETLPGKYCRAGPFRAWVTRLSNGKAVP
jgi:hypothetical protein